MAKASSIFSKAGWLADGSGLVSAPLWAKDTPANQDQEQATPAIIAGAAEWMLPYLRLLVMFAFSFSRRLLQDHIHGAGREGQLNLPARLDQFSLPVTVWLPAVRLLITSA